MEQNQEMSLKPKDFKIPIQGKNFYLVIDKKGKVIDVKKRGMSERRCKKLGVRVVEFYFTTKLFHFRPSECGPLRSERVPFVSLLRVIDTLCPVTGLRSRIEMNLNVDPEFDLTPITKLEFWQDIYDHLICRGFRTLSNYIHALADDEWEILRRSLNLKEMHPADVARAMLYHFLNEPFSKSDLPQFIKTLCKMKNTCIINIHSPWTGAMD